MSPIYAMRRANGDWFASDHQGRYLVPIFHSSGDAMIARARNTDMLLFKPVALDAQLLKQLIPASGGEVEFRIVSDPVAALNRGGLVELAQMTSMVAA